MATRKDCLDLYKQDLLDTLISELGADFINLDTLLALRDVANYDTETPKEKTSRCLRLNEAKQGAGIGWIENSSINPDEPELGPVEEIMPCVWGNGWVFDGENVPYEIEAYDGGNLGYNHKGDGYRLWTDGAMPTDEQRQEAEWDG